MKVWHETQPSEMCVRSELGKVCRLYGGLERDRGQSHSTQSYNGLSGSYLQERSTTINWPTDSSRAVHIQFHRPVKTIFHNPKGSQKSRLEQGMRPILHGDQTISYRTVNSDQPWGKQYTLPLPSRVRGLNKCSFVQRRRKPKAETNILREQISILSRNTIHPSRTGSTSPLCGN